MATSTLSYAGRLPGVLVAPAAPEPDDAVRLDVAGFVGFAATGPLDQPVAVADVPQFEAVFGPDLALCVDDAGTPQYAHLASAVRSFFANGGRRAQVVRVAGPTAAPTRWTLPGMALWCPDPGAPSGVTVRPARIESTWRGTTLDRVGVDTAVTALPLASAGEYVRGPGEVAAAALASLPVRRLDQAGVRPGDLLRLDLEPAPDPAPPGPDGPSRPAVLLVRVARVEPDRLRFDAEIAAAPNGPGGEAIGALLPATPYRPDAPTTLPVRRAVLLRFEITLHDRRPQRSPEVRRLRDLSLGGWAGQLGAPTATEPLGTPVRATEATGADLALGGFTVPIAGPTGRRQPEPPDQAGADGLDTFDPAVFTDARFAGSPVTGLVSDLEAVLLEATAARPRGVHALVAVAEVALVAVPDALHRGWAPAPPPVPEPPPPEPVVPPVDWSDFRNCALPPPVAPGTPTPAAPSTPPGETVLPLEDPVADYDPRPLQALHRGLITLCAARGDAVALLSLPRHLDPADVLTWLGALTGDPALTDRAGVGAPVLSHAAVYHPWVDVREPVTPGAARLRTIPPEGAVAGMIAAREAARGPWAAPAFVPLRGVVQVASALDHDTAVRLVDARLNLVRPRPGAFVPIGAHTLTADRFTRHLSVRRLLIMLRLLAERIGRRYVFEPNGEQLHTTLRLRFARLLEQLVTLGAIRAFTVTVDGSGALDGRLEVRIELAPFEPVEFLTLTLVRTGEGLLTVLEG